MKLQIKSITLTLLCIICAIGSQTHAQSPDWTWAFSGRNGGDAAVLSLAEDGQGNIYTIGRYSDSMHFGAYSFSASGNAQSGDLAITKHAPNGALLWVKNISAPRFISASAMVADKNGELYIAGVFGDSAAFGSITKQTVGERDIFLAKYSSDGNVTWVRTFGTRHYDLVYKGFGIDSKHNLLLAGYFSSDGPFVLDTITLNTSGTLYSDLFIAKFDSSGHVKWAKKYGHPNESEGAMCLAVDPDDNFFVAGGFSYQMVFDNVTVNRISVGFSQDNYLVKFDSLGQAIWGTAIGGNNTQTGHSPTSAALRWLTVDNSGAPVVGGYYDGGDILFSGGNYLRPSEYIPGLADAWIARYKASGQFAWAASIKSVETDHVFDIKTDEANNVYATGYYSNNCLFGTDTIAFAAPKVRGYNLFVVKYDSAGVKQWVKSAGTANCNAVGYCVLPRQRGGLLIGGSFDGAALTFDGSTLQNYGTGANGFIAHLDATTSIAPAPSSSDDITLWPNPAGETLHIGGASLSAYRTYTVVNVTGQTVALGIVTPHKNLAIGLSGFPGGLYVLRLQGPCQQPVIARFIKSSR